MMDITLIYALAATLFISLLSLLGIFAFMIGKSAEKKVALFFVAFSTGSLLGGAFLHLLPESIHNPENLEPYLYLLLGIIIFYLLERILKWHHCHDNGDCGVHTFTYMSLIGDSIHNFIDGLVIVSAFSVSTEVGMATTIAVASHEIPQELGDYFVLIHGGFSKVKALLWNFMSAATAIVGALVGYVLISKVENITSFVLPLAAGGFIYISMSDLIPELHKEKILKRSFAYFAIFIIGLMFMYVTKIAFE